MVQSYLRSFCVFLDTLYGDEVGEIYLFIGSFAICLPGVALSWVLNKYF